MTTSEQKSADQWRTCEFCGCRTNAHVRACCARGRKADEERSTLPAEKLLPCPFCGSSAEIRLIPAHEHHIATWMPPSPDTWIVECSGCDAGFCAAERDVVVAAWNRRAASDVSALRAEV